MQLTTNEIPARILLTGQESFVLATGKRLTIETSPAGQEILNTLVPAGKQWKVMLTVSVEEESV